MEQFGHVPLRLTNAQNLQMLQTTLAMSDDVSVSNLSSHQNEHFEGRTIFVGCRGPEISSVKEMNQSGRRQFKKELLIANQNCYM